MTRTFDFTEQELKGKDGELKLIKEYPELFKLYVENDTDLICKTNQKRVELKTDYYDMSKTPNFFMERVSVDRTGSPGGPWQALENNSDVFIYFFKQNSKLFIFNDVAKLVKRLDTVTAGERLVPVKNKGYNTLGYKVFRFQLKDLYHEADLGNNIIEFLK